MLVNLQGNKYYDEVAPFFWPGEACEQHTGNTVRKEFLRFLNEVPVLKVETDAPGHVVVIPVLLGDRLVIRVVTIGGISPGDAVPEPQTISIIGKRILDVVVIPFLSGPEPAEINGSTVTVFVKDHCLVVLEIEPVSIFCNGYDFPAAESLAVFLQKRGIPVQFVSSPEEASSVLVVFGGHKAEKTGEFVSWLLTDEQKQKLEQKGYKNVFIFENDRLIIVIAGNEREDTAKQVEESRRDIAAVL